MRLLVVSNLYPPVIRGGYEVECASVVAHLAQRHEVVVLTSSIARERLSAEPLVKRELDLVPEGARGTLSAPRSAIRGAVTMRALLEELRPDMAFIWNGAGLPHSALRVLADSGTPIAARVCEQWFWGLFWKDQFLRYLRPGESGLRKAWGFVPRAVNRSRPLRLDPDRRVVMAISWNSETVRAQTDIPPAVQPGLETIIYPATPRVDELRGLERRPEAEPRIAFMGRLQTQKGPDVAVRALGHLRREHGLEVRLTLAGHGDAADLQRLLLLAEQEGVAEAIVLPGALDRDGVRTLLSTSAVLVVPSVWQEPFGMVAIEGAAAGIPVVASDVGGISEGLHDQEHALLFAPGDDFACAAALRSCLTDTAATAARVRRALERSLDYTWPGYLEASDRFLIDAARALGVPEERLASASQDLGVQRIEYRGVGA